MKRDWSVFKELLGGIVLALLVFFVYHGLDPVPILLLGGGVIAFYALAQGRGLPGSGGKRFEAVGGGGESPKPRAVTFEDIGGQEVAKREFIEALEFVKRESDARKLGIRPLKGILLTGPPGTGKTLLAKAAAAYTDSIFIAASGSEFIEMYAGVGAQRVRSIFNRARQLAKQANKKSAIVFIDEIDALAGKRGAYTGHKEYDQTLNQLLVEMDGMRPDEEVQTLMVAATNRPDTLDSALLRPGRFDRIVQVNLPDKEGRLNILRIHTRNKPLAKDVDLEEVARETFGFAGAHLENLTNEAAILALRDGVSEIRNQDFREGIEKVIMGEKLDRRPRQEEVTRVAYHETGHALIREWLKPGSVASLTITSRGQALGYMRTTPPDDQFLYTDTELRDEIAVCLGGAVAEEVIFGGRSTGSSKDFEEAVKVAKNIVLSGLSSLGIVSKDDLPHQDLNKAIQDIIREEEERVWGHMRENESLLHKVVEVLRLKEKLSGDDFRGILSGEPMKASA